MEIKLNLEKPVVIYPELVRALGGLEEALFFQQLYYWSDKGGRKDGWIYKTKKEMEEETTLSRFQQDRVRKRLENKGVLETKLMKANGSPTLHYKITIGMVRNLLMEKRETYYSNGKKLTKPLTENTTEITTENTTSPSQAMDGIEKPDKDIVSIIDAFKDVNPSYRKYFGNKTQRAAAERLAKTHGLDKILSLIKTIPKTNKEKYAPTIMTPVQLEEKLGNLLLFIDKKRSAQQNNVF